MTTSIKRKRRIRRALFAAIAVTLFLQLFSMRTRIYAAAHNVTEAETIKLSDSPYQIKGRTSGMDESGNNIDDCYKFTTDDTPGLTYIFQSINVSADNKKNLWCRLQDAEGNDIYSNEDGIRNDFSYDEGSSSKTSNYKLEKNKTYYIKVQAYPTAAKINYRIRIKFKYDQPGKAVIRSLKSKKKKTLTASWKAVEGADKYRIAYKIKGGKWKYKTISGKSIKIKKLKSKKKYYFKVQALRTAGNKVLYGRWSAAKKVKIK